MDEPVPVKLLGKAPKKEDSRNLMAVRYLKTSIFPARYDFAKRRAPLPARTFGNTSYGDCTLASQANAVMRFERIEQRRTIILPDQTVIRNYLDMTGGEDSGWYELDALKRWRTKGFEVPGLRHYTIDAFAEINPQNIDEMKAALWQFKVIKVCFGLPIAWAHIDPPAYAMDGVGGVWGIGEGSAYEPYSWGGHSMMADAYDEEGIWVQHTWFFGPQPARQKVSWAAVQRYCDEAYSIVDSFDQWRRREPVFRLSALKHDVAEVTAD